MWNFHIQRNFWIKISKQITLFWVYFAPWTTDQKKYFKANGQSDFITGRCVPHHHQRKLHHLKTDKNCLNPSVYPILVTIQANTIAVVGFNVSGSSQWYFKRKLHYQDGACPLTTRTRCLTVSCLIFLQI